MRFNKQELATLAMQPSTKFEKEGILYIRERQEGFFRKSERGKKRVKSEKRLRNLSCVGGITKVNLERWCRLRGNLLFYFKSKDPWSEPLGVVVLEQCQVRVDPPFVSSSLLGSPSDGRYLFYLVFDGGLCQELASTSEFERSSWMEAIRQAGYEGVRAELNALRQLLERRRHQKTAMDLQTWRLQRGVTLDISELPLTEVAVACDNLLCDGHGKPPNPTLVVDVYMAQQKTWVQYGRTEIIEKSSNPQFLSTISFRASDGLSGDSHLRFTVFDVRERVSHTAVPLGSACVLLRAIQNATRLRIPLTSRQNLSSGFLTITSWSMEAAGKGNSTEHTPARVPSVNANHTQQVWSHRRSQSLPPRLGVKMRMPTQQDLKLLFSSPHLQTYRFHSGLGGDISVHEYMAESKLCFSFPHQMLDVWILQEKELLQEVAGMGELREPWHSRQVELLDRHLHLLRLYSQARENLQAHKGPYFKKSSRKADRSLEFVPINLHLQRMWVHNETINKSLFYDWITVGAFTAHSHRSKNGGLIKLVQQLKESPLKAHPTNYQIATKISMANDAIQAIKQLRKEVVEAMKTLMRLAKEKQTNGMLPICEDMINKTRILLSLWDPGLVEEALNFIEDHKLPTNDDSGVSEDFSLASSRPSLVLSPFKRITQQLSSMDLKSPELEDFATPCVQKTMEELWKVPEPSLLNTSDGLKSLCSTVKTPDDTNFVLFPDVEEDDSNVQMLDGTMKLFLDTTDMCNSPSANYYKPTDEPEPWDITQLNIEASVMCLVSKVKFLCGRCGSPAIRLKQPPKMDVVVVRNGNKFTEGLDLTKIADWAAELRPSMRKLRQAMDGLLKTARLTHSVFRVQEEPKQAQRVCNVRYRRDVCFSQALTSLVSGLMTRLWCTQTEPAYITTLSQLGPLAHFEGLLSYYGNEIDMWGDMSVAIEDLRTVLFTLVRSPSPSMELQPTPRVSGTRNSLTVALPVPDNLYSLLPTRKTFSFHVTPVYFNVGINEMASLAESLGATKPQERANIDNFDRLYEYYLRYRKINQCPEFAARNHGRGGRSIWDSIEQLRTEVHSGNPKNVEILRLSSQLARQLKGIRFTSCKSAKDRTGMSVTLEQCRILVEEYHLADNEFQRALDCMRSEGCRRENTMKNIGTRKYAFNGMQLLAFPKYYKPPPGTYGSAQS